MRYATILGILGIVLVSSPAIATVVPAEAPSGELSVYEIYNDMYGTSFASNLELDVMRVPNLETWLMPSSAAGWVEAQVAYTAVEADFGYYTPITGSIEEQQVLLSVPASSGPVSGLSATFDIEEAFGLYLDPLDSAGELDRIWYSQSGRNFNTEDHLIVYRTPDPMDPTVLLAWEDSALASFETTVNNNYDDDYNDVVIELRYRCEQEVVPEPATMVLLGLGLAGAAVRRFVAA